MQTSGSIGDVEETKQSKEQDEPILVARHLVVPQRENREPQSLQRRAVLRQCFVVLVVEPIESNRLVDAYRHSGRTRIVGNLYGLTTGQPS